MFEIPRAGWDWWNLSHSVIVVVIAVILTCINLLIRKKQESDQYRPNTEKSKQSHIAIKWALFNTITTTIIAFAIRYTGVNPLSPVKYICDIPFIVFLCLSQLDYRKYRLGFMTYGEGVVEGLLYGVFCGILSAIFICIYLGFGNPRALGIAAGSAVIVLFIFSIIGTIISLITAAIFRKERTI